MLRLLSTISALGVLTLSSAAADPRIDLEALTHRSGVVDRVESTRLASWEPDTFLESIAVLSNGEILITEAIRHDILRVTTHGDVSIFYSGEMEPIGLAVGIDDTVVATGRDRDGAWHVFVLSADGELLDTIPVPDAEFLNGATFLTPYAVLANDSRLGRIFRIDLEQGIARTWISDPLLLPDPHRPDLIPGANGIKLRDGAAYVSNSSQATMVRIPLAGVDFSAGEPAILHEGLVVDDFAIAVDGTIYATTHLYDTVVRVEPDGTVVQIATAEDGVEGSTAAAFGRSDADADQLYVVGDGGYYLDPENANRAHLVRLEVDDPGLTRMASLDHIPYPGQIDRADAVLVTCYSAEGAEKKRSAAAGRYTRFLELNARRLLLAGQLFGNGPDMPPTARYYLLAGVTAEQGLALMQASPYAGAGVYARCESAIFAGMAGTLLAGVAWEDGTSRAQP